MNESNVSWFKIGEKNKELVICIIVICIGILVSIGGMLSEFAGIENFVSLLSFGNETILVFITLAGLMMIFAGVINLYWINKFKYLSAKERKQLKDLAIRKGKDIAEF